MATDLDLPRLRAAANTNGMGNNLCSFPGWFLVGLYTALPDQYGFDGTLVRPLVMVGNLQKLQYIPDISHASEFLILNTVLNLFMRPGNMIGDMCAIPANAKYRQYITF